ncbi:hypothetical protein YC2023_020302 [Brassica napus]
MKAGKKPLKKYASRWTFLVQWVQRGALATSCNVSVYSKFPTQIDLALTFCGGSCTPILGCPEYGYLIHRTKVYRQAMIRFVVNYAISSITRGQVVNTRDFECFRVMVTEMELTKVITQGKNAYGGVVQGGGMEEVAIEQVAAEKLMEMVMEVVVTKDVDIRTSTKSPPPPTTSSPPTLTLTTHHPTKVQIPIHHQTSRCVLASIIAV